VRRTVASKKYNVWELREKYPHPTVLQDARNRDQYCVGGALCQSVLDDGMTLSWIDPAHTQQVAIPGDRIHFPDPIALREAIRKVNPDVEFEFAWGCAVDIVRSNDEGKFDEAWLWLDKALSA
jgi:hypothetical protein